MATKRLFPDLPPTKVLVRNDVALSPTMARKLLNASQFFQYEEDKAQIIVTKAEGVVFVFRDELIACLFEKMARRILGKKAFLIERLKKG